MKLIYIVLLIGLLAASWAQTLGGTVIPNQAVATYEFVGLPQPTQDSNTVTSIVPSVCGLSITPDGLVTSPAQQLNSFVGATVYLPYVLTNTGNGPQDYVLSTILETESSISPTDIQIILDSNNNQIADPTETAVTSLDDVPFGESVSLVVQVILDAVPTSIGDIYINLVGVCQSDATIRDDNNVSQITVLEGGIQNLVKSSDPASESFVVAGDEITYSVTFEVNEQPLSNVVLSDTLDVHLTDPSSLVVRVNGVVIPGVTDYDATSRTVTATLASLEPNSTVELSVTTQVRADTLGGITIRNQATVDFDGAEPQESNEVTHTTVATCGLVITPDGTVATPAYRQNALPGQNVVFSYLIRNIGNISATYDLSSEILVQSSVRPTQVRIIGDDNGNGQLDPGEVVLPRVTLDPGQSENLLLVLRMPAQKTAQGDAFVNVIGVCRGDASARDDNNVSQVTIPLGGFASPEKTAEPVGGTRVYPGVDLDYFISFTANGQDLSNVVVTDVLSEYLETPTAFTTGTVTDSETGLNAAVTGSYDAATRTMTWTLPSVPAEMTVRLEIDTRVRADLSDILANTVIENVAMVKSDDVETVTNTTTHPLSPIAILLRKTANPERVTIGETLFYTLEVINPDDSLDLQTLELSDTLPEVLRYQANTSVITLADGSQQEIEPTVEGQKITWALPGLKAGERVSILFATTVLPGAENLEEIVNTAQVVASDVNGRAVADAAASVGTVIVEGALSAKAVLLGTVFVDYNLNQIFDKGTDLSVENVRLYLSDGHSILTDKDGRYTFLELDAGIESLKVDTTTLPARLFEKTTDEVKPGLFRVHLEAGLITRQDIPLLPPQALLDIGQVLNVTMGPVKIQKSVVTSQGAHMVLLKISSSQALKNLMVTDVLPEMIQMNGQVSSSEAITVEGLSFALGDVPAGYQAILSYPIAVSGDERDALLAPVIGWEVRP